MAGLEAGGLHGGDDRADLVELAVGEHVALDEAAPGDRRGVPGRAADGVVDEPSSGRGQGVDLLEVLSEPGQPDVFEHPDRAHRVEGPVVDVAVVLHPDLDPVRQPVGLDPRLCPGGLLGGDGDPDRVDPVVPGGVSHEGPPAASDVEQAQTGSKGELLADQLHLGVLGRLQGPGASPLAVLVPQGTRVDHGRTEHELVEVVGHVVVVVDRRGVGLPRVSSAEPGPQLCHRPRTGLLGRRRERNEIRRSQEAHRVGPQPGGEPDAGQAVTESEHGVDVAVDLDVARDARPSETQLSGRCDHPPEGVAGADLHGCGRLGAGRPERRAVEQLDPDRGVVADQGRDEGAEVGRRAATCTPCSQLVGPDGGCGHVRLPCAVPARVPAGDGCLCRIPACRSRHWSRPSPRNPFCSARSR